MRQGALSVTEQTRKCAEQTDGTEAYKPILKKSFDYFMKAAQLLLNWLKESLYGKAHGRSWKQRKIQIFTLYRHMFVC